MIIYEQIIDIGKKKQNSFYEDKQNIPSQKSQTNQKHKGSPQEQIKKKTTTKNAFLSFHSSILKKNPEQILTAVAVRVLIEDISKSFLNHLL